MQDISTNIPTRLQSSIMLGNIVGALHQLHDVHRYDGGQFFVSDTVKGVHWPRTLVKLTIRWSEHSEEVLEQIGAINLFAVNSGTDYPFDLAAFMAGMMGKKADYVNSEK